MAETNKEQQSNPKDETPKVEQPSARAKPQVIELGESAKNTVKKIITENKKDNK